MNNYFRYENQPCPVCQQSFQPDDDIVVCPVCGTPHHRDCYKQNGECGNFEKHNEGFRWAPEKAEEPIETAQNENPPFSGSNIQGEDLPPFFKNVSNQFSLFPKELEDGVSTDEVAEFVGLSSPKYVQNFFYTKSNKRTFPGFDITANPSSNTDNDSGSPTIAMLSESSHITCTVASVNAGGIVLEHPIEIIVTSNNILFAICIFSFLQVCK